MFITRRLKWIFILLALSLAIASTAYLALAQTSPSPDTTLPPAIINFAADVGPVIIDALENREIKTRLTWSVVNLPPEYHITLQIYQLNEWGDVFSDEILPASADREIIIEPPLSFAPPTYRLAILNQDDEVSEERILTIPFDQETMSARNPEIEVFSSEVQNISAGDLAAHTARVNVTWRVKNRVPNSNIVFEQLLEDGSMMPVELARPFLWLPSSGTGVLAPGLPQQPEDPVRLRLRLVDMITGSTYDSAEMVLPLSGAVVTPVPVVVNTRPPNPVVVNTPQPTTTCLSSPLTIPITGYAGDGCNVYSDATLSIRINNFYLLSQTYFVGEGGSPRGDNLVVSWNITGAETTLLEVYDGNETAKTVRQGRSFVPVYALFTNLATSGTQSILVPYTFTNGVRIVLWAAQRDSRSPTGDRRLAYGIVDVPFLSFPTGQSCRPTFHFVEGDSDPYGCTLPVQRASIQAAYQAFEGGFMIWRADNDSITAFFNNGSYTRIDQSSYIGLPDNPISDAPPDGRFKPVSGFGKVWGNFDNIRVSLGWAFALEQGYTATLQYTQAPVYTDYHYLTVPDGRVVRLYDNLLWNYEGA